LSYTKSHYLSIYTLDRRESHTSLDDTFNDSDTNKTAYTGFATSLTSLVDAAEECVSNDLLALDYYTGAPDVCLSTINDGGNFEMNDYLASDYHTAVFSPGEKTQKNKTKFTPQTNLR
jgi:hypothetical protein